jgi:hypothetical protein
MNNEDRTISFADSESALKTTLKNYFPLSTSKTKKTLRTRT